MQTIKSLAITQPYLDCARGSRTPLLKPVFTRSTANLQNFSLASLLNWGAMVGGLPLTSKYHQIYTTFFNFKNYSSSFFLPFMSTMRSNGLCILSTAVFVKCV